MLALLPSAPHCAVIVFPFEGPENGSYKVFVLFIAHNVPAPPTIGLNNIFHIMCDMAWAADLCYLSQTLLQIVVGIKMNVRTVISSNINTEMCF